MIKWLQTFKITFLVLFWILAFGAFLPSQTFAATIPYTITTGIPGQFTDTQGQTFLTVDLTVDYQTGQIMFSSNPDGTGNTAVDDAAMIWVVERPDGSSVSTTYRYDNGCRAITPKPPLNVSALFKPGINKVQVKLFDVCGVVIASSPLYLVNTNAPEPIHTKTPLILIPGIGGSELKVLEDTLWLDKDNGHGGKFSYAYAKDEKVWVNDDKAAEFGDDDYFDVLRMKTDGITSEAPIGLTGNFFPGYYQEMTDFFDNNGYDLNKDLFIFPYDWRLDISHTKPLLDAKIQQIKQQTGSQKVDIVAHSMGGLVARNYIADPEKAQNIRKLFTLGTPHLGSVESLKTLRFGTCIIYGTDDFCLSIAPSEVKDVFQNMIAAYQLLPTQNYYSFYSNEDNIFPFPYKKEAQPLNYQQLKSLLGVYNHNIPLLDISETFHLIDYHLDNTNGVDVRIIAGSGQPTLGQISESTTTSLINKKVVKTDSLIINGDETVPLFSASLSAPSKNLFLNGQSSVYYTNQIHKTLAKPGAALNLVKNILENKAELPENVSTQPYPLPLLYRIFSVHSPVNIHIYDSSGNHTGLTENGEIETNIPGSSYDTLGDAKFIYVPEDGIYNVKFAATDQGSFDFKIREFSGGEQTKNILYKNIPLETTTKGETTFDSSSTEAPILEMDQEGDGIVDREVSTTSVITGEAVNDTTPPSTEVNISGLEGLNNWYTSDVTITLNPQDENSGILKTEYTIDNGETIHQYTEPFTITQEGVFKLKIKSYDKAGNEEEIQELEIKIDKTAPEAKIYVDQDQQNLTVKSIDENNVTVTRSDNTNTKKKNDAIYLLTDIAGNTLKLDVRDVENNNKDKFGIFSVQYNNNPVIKLDKNHFNVTYNGKKTRLNIKEQNFAVKDDIKIRIQYNQKKNQSTIITKEAKQERIKEVKNGITILNLTTNKGDLETTY